MGLRRWSLAAACAALLSAPGSSAVKAGDSAPAIALDTLLPAQPVENAGLPALAGKAVVLEFWATWCGPCVDAIPHLNQLADRFAGRPIRFLSITGEDIAVVEEFLKERPIRGWVGFDKANRLLHAYGFEGIPDTVLIDANGKIAAVTYPKGVTAEALEHLLAGKPVKAPPLGAQNLVPLSSTAGGPAPMLELIIRPTADKGTSNMVGPGKYEARGIELRAILSAAFDIPREFIEGDAADDPARYDVGVRGPKNQDAALQKLRAAALIVALQLNVKRETRPQDGWLLTAPNGKPPAWKQVSTSAGTLSWNDRKLHAVSATMAQLARIVQSMTKKPVADRTGITARFDFDLDYEPNLPESLVDALRTCGLQFEPARLSTEFLVVTRAETH